jgi:hypothetical protein
MYSPSGQLSCYDGHALIWLWRTITGQDGGKHTGRQCARQLYGEFSPPTQPQCVDNDRPNTFTNSSRNLLSVAIMPFRHSTICRSQKRINTQHTWSSHVCKQNVHVLSVCAARYDNFRRSFFSFPWSDRKFAHWFRKVDPHVSGSKQRNLGRYFPEMALLS